MHLVWLRNDLRVADNPALYQAALAAEADKTPLLAIYIWVEADRNRFPIADSKAHLIARQLQELRAELADCGIELVIFQVESEAHLLAGFNSLVATLDAKQVYFNNEYPWYERRRDGALTKQLRAAGVGVTRFDDRVIVAPGILRTGAGQPYKVFTPYKRCWLKEVAEHFSEPWPAPKLKRRLNAGELKKIAAAIDLHCTKSAGWQTGRALQLEYSLSSAQLATLATLWPVGSQAIGLRWQRFADTGLMDYQRARDFPAEAGTSTLSPYLALGAISPRQLLQDLLMRFGSLGDFPSGPATWLSELIWREFYQHLLVDYPELGRARPMQPHTNFFPWRGQTPEFLAWCRAETGYPIIDAAMRQLLTTGWMHNRLRMLTASFLCKNLQVDWRLGERFFMQHLIDGDFAANNGGWQWSASTGADAAPYFRVFNPVTQSRKFDPEARFLLRYLPQLEALVPKLRHDPQGQGYCAPVVDLAQSRAATIAAFAACKGFTAPAPDPLSRE